MDSSQKTTVEVQAVKTKNETISWAISGQAASTEIERRSSVPVDGNSELVVESTFVPDNREDVERFFRSDEFYKDNEEALNILMKKCVLRLRGDAVTSEPSVSVVDISEEIGRLTSADTQADLVRRVAKIVRILEGEYFYFTMVRLDENSREPIFHKNLSNVPPEIAQIYITNKWYATDPFLIHAKLKNEPIVSSHLGLLENLSGSWRRMGELGRANGLCSWLACPVHGANPLVYGVLRVANARLPKDGGETPLLRSSLLFRAIATEIFQWLVRRELVMVRKLYGLNQDELKALQLYHEGGTADDIACALNMSKRDLYKSVYRSINAKMNCRNISEAARLAVRAGLIPPFIGKKVVHVVHHPRWGVYLGSEWGMPFWSKVNPVPHRDAVGFETSLAAEEFVRSINGTINADDYAIARVEVDQTTTLVLEDLCVKAGLPPWTDSSINLTSAPDESTTPGSLDDPSPTYH
ncbi:hypothetical protein FAZ95_38955 [Trinickia violacea]|uniref:Transcription factor LuxR-like autoinducer-binding domain-containing protein n=1 Tax=Trinickia violacea TaxID=2571746 RepID=A0A4P8J0D4_9BURK|nr:autoinducer binding domain-containing protein [Trinickia violacea]QCP55112.1 hypothetical protein FAZ95_38955 [Trinickia violacea]